MPAKKKSPQRNPAGELIPERLAPLLIRLRRENVILDSEIAALYGVETKVLNQAVKRNMERFPFDFMFQLSEEEMEILRSQSVTSSSDADVLRSQSATLKTGKESLRSQIVTLNSKRGQHRKYRPYAFTEQGVAMLSSVLRSQRAVEVNIAIMRTFVQLRSLMQSNKSWLGLVVPVRRGDILSPLFRRRIHPRPRNSASTPSSPKPLPPRPFATSAPLR